MASLEPGFPAALRVGGGGLSATAHSPVVLAAAATGIVEQIERRGGDIDSIFGNTGVSPAMAGSPTLPIKLACFCQLFEEAAHRTGDGNFGLWFGNQFRPHDLGLWGYLAVSSPTLGAALRNIIETFPFHQQHSLLSLAPRNDGLLMLQYQIRAPDIVERRQDAELSLGMFLNMFRECLGRGWTPEMVYFEHPRPLDADEHEAAFGAPAYFSQPTNALVFRPDVLEHPMPRRDPRMMAMMHACLEALGSKADDFEPLIDRVRIAVRTRLPEGWPSLEAIGEDVRLSPASIQRELARVGLTYKALVQTIRRDLAFAYLRQRHLPLSEIAFLLGYSELSAFSRAVRRWTGRSPKTVRNRLLGG